MSIPWNTIRPVLLSLFGDLSGLQTVWIDKRRPYIDPKEQAAVFLRVRSTESIGVDDRRFADLGKSIPEPTCEESANGHRRVSLDVRVESFRHEDNRFAFNAASKIRSKLGFRSSLSRLRAVNVALIRAGQVIDLTGVIQDDRITSVATLDLILNVGISVADTDNPEFNIETVENPFDNPNTVFNPP